MKTNQYQLRYTGFRVTTAAAIAWLAVGIPNAIAADTAEAQKVHAPRPQGGVARDLSKSYDLTKDPANKSYFDREIRGDGPSDYEGTLKPGDPYYFQVTTALLTREMVPEDTRAIKVGLIKFAESPDTNLAWVYVANQFTSDREIFARLSVGIVSSVDSADTELRFVATPIKALELRERESLGSFVDHPYDLGALGQSWGIRIIKSGCGAGGSICSTTYLKLVAIQNGKLTVAFDEAISYYGNYGGDWNKDGTRQHIVEENAGVLVVGNDLVDKIPMLILQAQNGRLPVERKFKPIKTLNG